MVWIAVAVAAILAVVVLWTVPRLQGPTGTLVVVAAGRSADSLPASTLSLSRPDGTWVTVGSISGAVPAAPTVRELFAVPMPVGNYVAARVGEDTNLVSISVTAGRVEPLLLGIDGGHVLAGAVYAGNDDLNVGLGELSGKFVAIQPFDLVDQAGFPFRPASIAGKDLVLAAFHTSCHETCPLYTALFLQLEKKLPAAVILAEVTTDPAVDTPSTLSDYAKQVGAGWTFATGTSDQVAGFWKQFGVELAAGDAHTSTLILVDRHGYVRLIYRGVPSVGRDVPPSLITSMSAQGLRQLASGGDGWGAPDVLQALSTVSTPGQFSNAGGGKAPAFTLASTDGGTVSLGALTGKPIVINFWRSDCPPCRAEMPLLQQRLGGQSGIQLVLVNWGESSDTAKTYLARLGIHQGALIDADLSVGRAYGVEALPTTVFVRSDGIIDRRHIGQLDEGVLSAEISNLASQ